MKRITMTMLCVLFLVPTATAQTTLLNATMTVGVDMIGDGYSYVGYGRGSYGSLSSGTIQVDGASYRINRLNLLTYTATGVVSLSFGTEPDLPDGTSFVLMLDGEALSSTAARRDNTLLDWHWDNYAPNPVWTDGQNVRVVLQGATGATPTPAVPLLGMVIGFAVMVMGVVRRRWS